MYWANDGLRVEYKDQEYYLAACRIDLFILTLGSCLVLPSDGHLSLLSIYITSDSSALLSNSSTVTALEHHRHSLLLSLFPLSLIHI